MSTPTIRELVEPWFKIMTALNHAWGPWRDLGVGIEAPFPDAVWRIATAYTKSVEMLVNHLYGIEYGWLGFDYGWLGWFMWEKPEGQIEAVVDGRTFDIETLDDLIEMLNAIATSGGGK